MRLLRFHDSELNGMKALTELSNLSSNLLYMQPKESL